MTQRLQTSSLEGMLRGEVMRPGDDGYHEARTLWNGMIDRRPAAIVRCLGVADVRQAIRFAREHGLAVTAKGGGHQVAGTALCDDGIVIDLGRMSGVHIDVARRRARVGPGATWAAFDHEAQGFGLATTGGVDSRTGVAGLTLGGGVGYLARRFGLAADNLVSADVALADGVLVTASEDENPELFWGLRGGGASLGVVTSFEFSLHEVGPQVMTAQAYHLFEDVHEVLRFYRDFATEAPEELACYALILKVPPIHPFPEAHHGRIGIGLVAVHSGDLEAGAAALGPLETFGSPILAAVQQSPYAALQQAFDAGTPDGGRYYYKSQFVDELSDGLIDAIAGSTEPLPGAYTMIGIEPLGGAIGRVDRSATAFAHRDAAFNLSAWAGWIDSAEDDRHIAWARAFHGATAPHGATGVYVNYLDRDDADRVSSAFGENHLRLTRVKATYDPDNLFRTHRSLVPSA